MRSKNLAAAFLCLCFSAASLFSLGAGDDAKETEQQLRDPVWTLAITAFDTSALSPSNAALAQNIMRDLAGYIGKVSYRLRVSEEYAHYEGLARRTDLAAAALALANKRNERDRLIYRGEQDWKYRRDVKAVDAEIKKLEENYLKVQTAEILVETEPKFTLSPQNLEGLFPAPPAAGEEAQYCKNQKLDALIAGTIREYHDRLYVTHKLYVAYLDSYVFQDSILFSSEELTEAIEEFAGGITLAVTGLDPAELRIDTQPDDAQVFLDSAYAGRGEISSPGRPPGTVILEVFADKHESVTAELDLKSGEITEVQVNLRPVETSALNITVPATEAAAVYQGSLYMGQAPITLELPAGVLEYVFVETPGGEEAKAIFLSPSPGALPPAIRTGRRNGLFAGLFPSRGDLAGNNLSLVTGVPYDPKGGRVDKVRRGSYWAWGGVWVSAITAWLVNGHYNSVVNAYNNSSNRTREFYDRALQLRTLNYVGIGLVSAAVLIDIIQMLRYINTAGKDAPVFVD
ncbi:MAG: PEGA domain-containing protein [Treponema sp.]|jgi:hypothetical protein|nr:PEGA domain-containing protein [Treponema sp.]